MKQAISLTIAFAIEAAIITGALILSGFFDFSEALTVSISATIAGALAQPLFKYLKKHFILKR